ncbi:uncharacterized protein LOC125277609 [Megalobrama amblycephala]|uniref:uncharacterized protein LOC125277609 n=1 Tax=Megalobrama amblycephala TaxID=75352 RepID=UPI002013E03B|nr:uncharacterized protein LOC125277609 [Megalobrama amblycephala]
MADGGDVEQMIDRVVLEQFTTRLPKKTAEWVQCHRPTSLDSAIQLAEDHLVACPGVGEPLPSVSLSPSLPPLSLSKPVPLPRSRPPGPPRVPPRGRGGTDSRQFVAPRAPPRGAGLATAGLDPAPASPLSPRQSFGPFSATGAAGRSGPACWRCGDPDHFIDRCPVMEVGTLIRVPDDLQVAPGQAGQYQIPTDASDRGLGAVLSQEIEGEERPVLYISRKLSKREAKYSTVEKECLAIRWAVLILRYYLLGREFTLCSDHAPLQWLHRMKDTNARITRWYLALQPFKFKERLELGCTPSTLKVYIAAIAAFHSPIADHSVGRNLVVRFLRGSRCAYATKIPEEDKIEFGKQYLKDEAKMKFMLNGNERSVEEIFDALHQTYGDKLPIGSRLKEFYDRTQMPGETIRSYAYDLQEKLSIIQNRKPSRVPDADGVLKDQLVLGLKDDSLRREMKRRVKTERDLTFIQLMQEAITWSEEEEVQVPSNLRSSTRSRGVVQATTATDSSTPLTLEKLHEAIQRIAARQEELFQMVNNKEKVKPQEKEGKTKSAPLKDGEGRYICYGKPGHTSRRCSQNRENSSGVQPLKHKVEMEKTADQVTSVPTCPGPSVIRSHTADCDAGNVSKALCESAFGSEVTTITESHFKNHFGEVVLSSAIWVRLTAANGLNIPIIGCLEADIECMRKTLHGKCVFVIKESNHNGTELKGLPGIVGMNVLSDLRDLFMATEGMKKMDRYTQGVGEAKVQRVLANIKMQTEALICGDKIGFVKVAGKQAITIPPFSERVLEGRCRIPPKVSCQVLDEASSEVSLPESVLIANVLTKIADGKVPVRVLNSSEKAVKLMPRCRIATLCKPQKVVPKVLVEFEEKEGALHVKAVQQHQVKVEESTTEQLPVAVQTNLENLTEAQRGKLQDLLTKPSDVFSKNDCDFGYTTSVTHNIHTGDAPPIKQRHRRIPPQVFQEVKRHVRDLVSQGILRESCSPWASPAVTVIKDGSVRFCCDYRRLNKVTCKDAYPLPRVEESLDTLGNAQLFSTLDLTSGYFQVAMSEEDRAKTAITTPFGLFEWTRMPFGLCNAPATFQRLMGVVLGDLTFDILLIYLDDIIVFSKDFDSHCQRLETVFNRLRQHGLKLKPSKCFILKPEVKFLGHLISSKGIQVDGEKTRALETWPVPKNVKELRQVLGFMSYYRRLVPDFAKLAQPLHALVGKGGKMKMLEPFNWTTTFRSRSLFQSQCHQRTV